MIKAVASVPLDLTFSLSKRFHNTSKLYNNTTVCIIPYVMGVRSGVRAAGEEDILSFSRFPDSRC
jgi:hypothetical protein